MIQKYKVIFSFYILSLILSLSSYQAVRSSLSSLNRNIYLDNFNQKMSRLSKHLRGSEMELICRDLEDSRRLIASHLNDFRDLEPYYDWSEIQKVLNILNETNCDKILESTE